MKGSSSGWEGTYPDLGRASRTLRREGITRARVTQVMGLLRLAPEIQQEVLSLPDAVRRPAITERALRPIAQFENPPAQHAAFLTLLDQ